MTWGASRSDAPRQAAHLGAAAAGALVLLAEARSGRSRAAKAAAALVSAEALLATSRQLLRTVVRERYRDFNRYARAAIAAAYFQLVIDGLPPDALGLHVYLVRRRSVPPFNEHLIRAAKVRLGGSPPNSGIVWVKGKGVIGRCWAEKAAVLMDADTAYGPYRDAGGRPWEEALDDVRLNLTAQDFRTIGDRYSAVAAVPILDSRGEVKGCVVADVLAGAVGKVLLEESSVRVLADAAAAIGAQLDKLPKRDKSRTSGPDQGEGVPSQA
jgi:hypothetical protein